jgi:hypothetical protein
MITGPPAAGGLRFRASSVYGALSFVLPISIGMGAYVLWRNKPGRGGGRRVPRTPLVPETS